jgi:dCTP deaminase
LQRAGVVDVDKPNAHKHRDFWEPIHANKKGRLILEPRDFYILASKESIHVPPRYAAEMAPIDPMMGEFRAHYAGFFDPGFGHMEDGQHGSKAVLEVRSHDVPFVLEDGQIIARLVYERLTERPTLLYGQGLKSNYQGQGLKLSKHFK